MGMAEKIEAMIPERPSPGHAAQEKWTLMIGQDNYRGA